MTPLWAAGHVTHNPEKRALLNCENQWTRRAKVILNPPSNEPVDTTATFTPPTTCHGGTGDTRRHQNRPVSPPSHADDLAGPLGGGPGRPDLEVEAGCGGGEGNGKYGWRL